MSILNHTENIRQLAKAHGKYRDVAEKSGVGYQWLTKFATGSIKNPRVETLAKLELFFKPDETKEAP